MPALLRTCRAPAALASPVKRLRPATIARRLSSEVGPVVRRLRTLAGGPAYAALEHAKAQRRLKQRQNRALVDAAAFYLQDVYPNISAAVIDTRVGTSTRALIETGVPPAHIAAVNYDAQNVPLLGNVAFGGSFASFIELSKAHQGARRDFVFYDGTQTLPSIYRDLYHMFEILADRAVVAVVFSARHKATSKRRYIRDVRRARRVYIETLPEPYNHIAENYYSADISDNHPVYLTDMLIRNYACKHRYLPERIYPAGFDTARYKATNPGIAMLCYLVTRAP